MQRSSVPETKEGGLLSLSLTSRVTSISVVRGGLPESEAVALRTKTYPSGLSSFFFKVTMPVA